MQVRGSVRVTWNNKGITEHRKCLDAQEQPKMRLCGKLHGKGSYAPISANSTPLTCSAVKFTIFALVVVVQRRSQEV